MQRLAVVPSPPLLLAAAVVAGLGGFVVARGLLERELEAPRLSDSRISAPRVASDPDLDGDGIPDRFDGVYESCGAGGCAYEVYLRRPGGDDQYVGRMEGYWPFQIERVRDDEPADVIAGARYRFSDGRYRR